MIRAPLLSLFAAGVLVAQDAVDPRCFMVHDYTNVVAADFRAMRELEVLDELESSALKMAFGMARDALGFPLEALDRFSLTMHLPTGDAEGADERRLRIFVFEGAQKLARPEGMAERFTSYQHRGRDVYLRFEDREHALAWPTDKLHVMAPADIIEQAMDGKRKPGLPSADVMSLSVGKGRGIAHMVADLSERSARRTFLDQVFEGSTWPEDDMPTFFAGRVAVTGDEDDRHLTLTMTLRHAKVGPGVKASDEAVDALLERALAMKELRLFRKILKSAEKETRGSDVIVRVDLGRTRNAVGNLAMVMAPLFLMSGVDSAPAVQRVQVAPAVQEAKPADKPKAGGGGR
jgi:hypothetical protein